MPPLLYIILLSAVLLLMVYWVIASAKPGEPRYRIPNHNMFSWESAQELFKYLETEEFYLAKDSIKLLRTDSGHLRTYWRISPGRWQEILKHLNSDNNELVLRINKVDNMVNELEVKVKRPAGCYDWDLPVEGHYYASIGIKDKDNYTPFLESKGFIQGL